MKSLDRIAIYFALLVVMLAIGSANHERAVADRHIADMDSKEFNSMLLTWKHENASSLLRKESDLSFLSYSSHLPSQPRRRTSVDLTILGIEVTQSIQCFQSADPTCVTNNAPLVHGKASLIRVYVKLSDRDDAFPSGLSGVRVKIRIYTESDSTIWYTTIVTGKQSPQRSNLDDTANFLYQNDDTDESIVFIQAEVNFDRAIPETNYRNNLYPDPSGPYGEFYGIPVAFYNTPPLRVMLVAVGSLLPGAPAVLDFTTLDFIKKTYPVSEVLPSTGPAPIMLTTPLLNTGDWGMLLARIRALKDNDMTVWGTTAHWYGLVNPLISLSSIAGFGGFPDPNNPASNLVAAGLVSNGPVAAQEIGHNLNRNHAPGCGAGGIDISYPMSDGSTGDVGWDSSTNSLMPKTDSDFMGYCARPYWISAYTANAIFNYRRQVLRDAPSPISVGPVPSQEYLLVNGLIQADDEVTVQPFQHVMRPKGWSDDPGVGPYSLELQTSDGKVLFERQFTPIRFSCFGACDDKQTAIAERVPYSQAARRLVIKKGDRILKTIAASPHAPTVVIRSPDSNGKWGHSGYQTISWQAHDLDGDHLTYHLLFSRDDGLTWSGVATYLETTSITLDVGMFPGTDKARFRIIAMDGFNTTSDDSKHAFRIERKPPRVTILSPASDASIRSGAPLVLRGLAYDLEDGNTTGGNLVWKLDQHTVLGTGDELIWYDPPPGLHILSLTGRDSDQNSVGTTVHITVKPR